MTICHVLTFPILVGFFAIFGTGGCSPRQAPRQNLNSQTESITSIMSQAAEMQVQKAKVKYGVTLDYQPDSIQKVNTILGQLHGQYLKSQDDKRWDTEGIGWGAYVGEVIRRKYGGEWAKEDKQIGQSLPLHWSKSTSFPVAWCVKRIRNGDEDNIWIKYQMITSPEYDKMMKGQK